MENGVIKFVKKCPVYQLQNTNKIKMRADANITDTQVDTNDKIAMDIFGPLPMTTSGNAYVLSVQD